MLDLLIGFISLLIASVSFALIAGVIGCVVSGIDRKISARMQGRVGPSILQPLFDFMKLLVKERVYVSSSEGGLLIAALLATLLSGGIFFTGGNFLLSIFILSLGEVFFLMAAWSSRSPFAEAGCGREALQVMAYEPMIIFVAVGIMLVCQSGNISAVFTLDTPLIFKLPLIFVGFIFVLTIKLRKSPFDLSSSHHAHQDLVSGITTEMSGPHLAIVEFMHWVENILFMCWAGLFFVTANPLSWLVAFLLVVLLYLFEIWIDNNFARVKWQRTLSLAWGITLICTLVNFVLM